MNDLVRLHPTAKAVVIFIKRQLWFPIYSYTDRRSDFACKPQQKKR